MDYYGDEYYGEDEDYGGGYEDDDEVMEGYGDDEYYEEVDTTVDVNQYQAGVYAFERLGGEMLDKDNIALNVFISTLYKEIQNSENIIDKDDYYKKIINWDRYYTLNPRLLVKVADIFYKYKTFNVDNKNLKKYFEESSKNEDYTVGDMYRYWRYIKNKLSKNN